MDASFNNFSVNTTPAHAGSTGSLSLDLDPNTDYSNPPPAHSNHKTCSQPILCGRFLSPVQTVQTVGLSEPNGGESVDVKPLINHTDKISAIHPIINASESKSAASDSASPDTAKPDTAKKEGLHLGNPHERKNNNPRGIGGYPCKEGCEKTFSSREARYKHHKKHKGRKEYKCDKCPAEFTLKHELNAHLDSHLPPKSYSCLICDKKLSFQKNIKEHVRQVHFIRSRQIENTHWSKS